MLSVFFCFAFFWDIPPIPDITKYSHIKERFASENSITISNCIFEVISNSNLQGTAIQIDNPNVNAYIYYSSFINCKNTNQTSELTFMPAIYLNVNDFIMYSSYAAYCSSYGVGSFLALDSQNPSVINYTTMFSCESSESNICRISCRESVNLLYSNITSNSALRSSAFSIFLLLCQQHWGQHDHLY